MDATDVYPVLREEPPEEFEADLRSAPAAIRLPLKVFPVEDLKAFTAIAPEWQRLDESLTPRTPFTSPLWNMLWWKHYSSHRLLVRDRLQSYVVRDAEGTLVAVAPMMLTKRPSRGPVRARVLQFFGADRNISEIRGLACLPENQEAAVGALEKHLAGRRGHWDWLDWGMLRRSSPEENCTELQGPFVSETVLTDYHLELPATWEEFRASRSRNIKESLRKCYNSLKREGLTPELRVIRWPEDSAAAVESFFALHAARGQAENTVKHPIVFATERDRDFLRDITHEMAKCDRLRIFQLHVSGQLVATRIGFLLGDELYLYYSGYDPAWGKFSVMTTLVAEALKWAIESGLKTVNLSTGTDVSKLRWSPNATHFRSAIQIAPRWSARLAFNAYRRARALIRDAPHSSLLGTVRR